ncbi:MAG: hypothetical protein PQJ58_23020 [Spirochaetales bacterium]|nr:hypothetical protein [Spirochaetales bacterium]
MSTEYEFLGIDEGKQNLFRGDTGSGKIHWTKSLSSYPTARALQRLDEGRVLMGYEKGYCVVDIKTGDIVHDCPRWDNISSAFRDEEGYTLLTGTDLEGMIGVCVITLDQNDRIVHKAVQKGDYVRLMTVMDRNAYMLSTNDHITLCDRELNTLNSFSAEGFLHAWQSRKMSDGALLVSAGYGAFMAKFTAEGKLLETFGRAGDLPPEIQPYFYAAFDFTDQGHILLANWQGHGPDNGHKGRQLLLFDSDGKYLDSWSFPDEISSFQGLLILDQRY